MQRVDFKKLYDLKRLLFINKIVQQQHAVITKLLPFFLMSDDICELQAIYDVSVNTRRSVIKNNVFSQFENSIMPQIVSVKLCSM